MEGVGLLKGVALSVSASCLFAGMYYVATLLAPLTGEQVFGLRMLLTLPCVTLFMVMRGEWPQVIGVAVRLRQAPWLIVALLVSSGLIAIQQWLFMWAPLNGQGLQVSLGYFLLPLSMLLVGRGLYKERLSGLQQAAAFCAALGVAHELYRAGGFSWVAGVIACGLPLYFVLRRKLLTDHLGGLWFDMALVVPLAVWLLMQASISESFVQQPRLYLLIGVLAVLSALSFICYILASRCLPMGLFGLLGYVEPVLIMLVSLLLGERLGPEQWLTYVPVWLAVTLLVLEGGRHLRRRGGP